VSSRPTRPGAPSARVGASSEAAQKWQEYHLIGDELAGGKPHPTGTADRVRLALESEPAIIARPRGILDTTSAAWRSPPRPSVATIGVVGWIGSQGGPAAPGAVVAKNPTAIQPVALKPAASRPRPTPRCRTTSRAHRQLPSPELYRHGKQRECR
jgi:negative regulator of sigma E activity